MGRANRAERNCHSDWFLAKGLNDLLQGGEKTVADTVLALGNSPLGVRVLTWISRLSVRPAERGRFLKFMAELSSEARRAVLAALAVLYAAATLFYSGWWLVAVRTATPEVELGLESTYLPAERAMRVDSVAKGSPAEKAGLRVGDQIIAFNRRGLEDENDLTRVWMQHRPGDTVQLTIRRPGLASPLVLTGVFRRRRAASGELSLPAHVTREVQKTFPVPFVIVGLTVLFLRLPDRNAWLLALLCGSFTTTPSFPNTFAAVPQSVRLLATAYHAILFGQLGALFYFFFAVFPARSPLDRRLPWLKWAAILLGISLAVPGLKTGELRLPPPLPALLGADASAKTPFWCLFAFVVLGLFSLAQNFRRSPDSEARRKIRVVFWGTVAGLTPALIEAAIRESLGYRLPGWLSDISSILAFLFPLAFAYAVVKHRVLDIPVLLRRSGRYLLVQRGFTFLLSLLSIGLTLLFAFSFAPYVHAGTAAAPSSGIALGAVFGTALLWGGSQVHRRVSGKIDRAFFRAAYDARVILEDLADKTRKATGREELARLLERYLRAALQPSFLAVYFRLSDDRLTAASGDLTTELESIPADSPVLAELAEGGRPRELHDLEAKSEEIPALSRLKPDSLVPILARGGRLVGLLVLGPRLSEEPYSGEDRRLLASVAGQTATALENIQLAEEIAERIEDERRAAREMDIAREVQTRLLPQALPQLDTLDCAARCIQARAVGGDYYDFLDLGSGRTGFVLADVSGKGVHAALLMANLQAHLRSQCGVAPLDPVRLLEQVNRLLRKSTATEHYATLFFGIYEDALRLLTYVNCGHNPPMWLRAGASLERLPATATVLGVFEPWECSACQIRLATGDLLAVFSDGVSEASRGEEEFGEERLIEELQAQAGRPAEEIVTAILNSVQQFSAGAQSDDLTLLIARAR